MRGEHGCELNACERGPRVGRGNACGAHSLERAAYVTGLNAMIDICSASATLAVVGFREVDELEVEGESARELIHVVDRKRGNQLECLREQRGVMVLALGDRDTPQTFDRIEQRLATLLTDRLPQQLAERAHVAPERRFLVLAWRA